MRIERPSSREYAPFQADYVSRVSGPVDPVRALSAQLRLVSDQLRTIPPRRAVFRYAPGKWSVKELVGHLGDTERILSYRLLRIARGDATPLPGFEEDAYVAAAGFDRRRLADLIEDWRSIRAATIRLVAALPENAWTRRGIVNGKPVSSRALLYIILGHVEHHRSVLATLYGVVQR